MGHIGKGNCIGWFPQFYSFRLEKAIGFQDEPNNSENRLVGS